MRKKYNLREVYHSSFRLPHTCFFRSVNTPLDRFRYEKVFCAAITFESIDKECITFIRGASLNQGVSEELIIVSFVSLMQCQQASADYCRVATQHLPSSSCHIPLSLHRRTHQTSYN